MKAHIGPESRAEQRARHLRHAFLLRVMVARGWTQANAAKALGIDPTTAGKLVRWYGERPLWGREEAASPSVRLDGLVGCRHCGRALAAAEMTAGECFHLRGCVQRQNARAA